MDMNCATAKAVIVKVHGVFQKTIDTNPQKAEGKGTKMTTFRKLLQGRLLSSTFCATAAILASPAMAQSVDQDQVGEGTTGADVADVPGDEGAIIVTGSRIRRPEIESVSPVTTLGQEDIDQTGTTRVEDLVNNLPQAFASQSAFISNGASGTATVNLRGLGSSRTLVLVDGRRIQPGDPFEIAPDLNQIPAALVERVEIVTGGASSVYGADAVAGVVNFIMDRDFKGIQADAQVSFYDHNNKNDVLRDLQARDPRVDPPAEHQAEGFTYNFNLTVGAGFDDNRGHVTAYVGYRKIEAVLQADYDVSNCALAFSSTDPSGYICSGSPGTPNGTFNLFDDTFTVFRGTRTLNEADGGNTFRPFVSSRDAFNFAPTNYFQRPDKRYTAGFFADYEISDSIKPYAEFMFMDDRSVAQIAFSGTFNGNEGTISCDNPFLSDPQRATLGCTGPGDTVNVLINKRLVEGEPRQNDLRHTSYRGVVGVRGDITENFRYDAYAQRGTTIYANTYLNDLSTNRINQALDAVAGPNGTVVCRDPSNGCVPLNVFRIGGVTREAFEFIAVPGLQNGDITQNIVSGFVQGDLGTISGKSDIGVVLGAEYRQERLELRVDQNFSEGTLAGQGGPTAPVAGEFDVKELFAEVVVPIIEDGFVDQFTVEGGYRLSDYSTTGTSHTYKIGATLAPISAVKLRGVYSRSVRSPNILNLFTPQTLGLFGGDDPCAGPDPTATAAQCALTGVTAAQFGNVPDNPADQFNQVTGGNPDVDVEKSDSYTAGVVLDGRMFGLRNLSLTVDYFNISVEGTIGGIGAQSILNNCLSSGDATFCDLINRDASGSLFLTPNAFITNTTQNVGGLKTDGLDIGANFQFPVFGGNAVLDYVGTYLFSLKTQDLPTSGFGDCVGFYGTVCGSPNPEYRHRLRVGYRGDVFGATLGWRYYGGVRVDQLSSDPDIRNQALPDPKTVDNRIKAYNWFDLSTYFDVSDNFRLTAGVNNIFDKDPPSIGGAFGADNGNTYPGQYDPIGRYLFLQVSVRY